MNKRNRLWAIVASGVLTLGIAGVALATDLNEGQVGDKLSSFTQSCTGWPEELVIGPGEIGVHFILEGTTDVSTGLLDATFSTDSFTGLAYSKKAGPVLMWYAVITGDGNTTIDSASTTATGNNLNLSHVCAGSSSSSTTSFSSSQESSTTSVASSTTSFSSSQESTTTSVTQPPTDTIGNSGSGNQATGMWLLVAALGVLLGSLVVVAPARAKNKR
jgi:hypothetical protein